MGPHLFTREALRASLTPKLLLILILVPQAGSGWIYAQSPYQAKAEKILSERCSACHSNGATEGPADILDFRHLRSRKYLVPGNPKDSTLLRSVESKAMPRDDDPLEAAEIAVLREWIKSLPADFGADKGGEVVSDWEVLAAIEADVGRMSFETARFTRYLTLAHFVTAGDSTETLVTYRQGLSKLVNSLSWGSAIIPPVAIDSRQTVFRIDLRNYGWDVALWDKVAGTDPYHISYESPRADLIRNATKTTRPIMRADIFAKRVSVPPFYHEFLQIPDTFQDLERMLGIDLAANIKAGRVIRAGFNESNVSHFNRMVERHATRFGSLWISYDFAGVVGRQSIFAHPLGPAEKNASKEEIEETFKHDGGEIIFNLPNGLQAYMLATGEGKRLDKAPQAIVSDVDQPDRAVVNGLSCMKCHSGGMIRKDDQVRASVLENPGAFKDDKRNLILKLYVDKTELNRLYALDEDRFQKSLAKAVTRYGSAEKAVKKDPVFQLVKQFEGELDVVRAAAETGLPPAEFVARMKRIPDLAARFAGIAAGTTIHREAWIDAYPRIVTDLALRHEVTRNSQGMTMAYVPAGEFQMGSPSNDTNADADEKPQRTARIAKSFRMGRCEVTIRQWQRFATETGFVGTGAYRWDRRIRKFVFADNASWKVTGFEQSDDHPVTNISFDDAQAYCRWLSAKEGKTYRLPTEAEFEYCCRAGTKERFFTGDDAQILANVSNLADESLVRELTQAKNEGWNDGFPFTAPVAQFRANPFGLFDMNGNVWEFCLATPSGGDREVPVRGGGWFNPAKNARSAERMLVPAAERSLRSGFRVVCEN